MNKLLSFLLLFAALQAKAQIIATIGNDSISAQDFLRAYKKSATAPHSAKAMQEYLELYIAAQLKIKEATARGYDTLPQFRADIAALRAQVLPAYLADPQSLKALTSEAFARSQKDLHVAHVFIALPNAFDITAAFQKASKAYALLKSGTAFEAVARPYSDDPEAATNGGDLGFITVFSLPYELENLAYSTPAGQIAPLHRSAAGYHIFKILSERKALGRIEAAQILLAFSPQADAAEKAALHKRADSLYRALQKGASFEALAERWSNDALSAPAGGLMPQFGVGRYEPIFEKPVFALPRNGAVSVPFETAHGVHIVKRIKLLPVNTDAANATAMQALRDEVLQSDRMNIAQQGLAAKVLAGAGYKPLPPALLAAVKTRTEQALHGATEEENELSGETPLFTLGGTAITLNQWLAYARDFNHKEDGSSKAFAQLWNEFVQAQAMEYYSLHLEQYNADFAAQMKELKEGALFFEIMQQEIWSPAQTDSVALRRYYDAHRENYRWKQSADVLLFYAPGKAMAQKLGAQVAQKPARWRRLAGQYSDVTTDSVRLEWSTVPGAEKLPFKAGQLTSIVTNEADSTASFAYILKTYNQPLQRSFEESRGAVINDYQAQKEKAWVEGLRKKYVVKVDEDEWKKLNASAQ